MVNKGTVIEDWHGNELLGIYVVSMIPLGDLFGSKYALLSLDGNGLANGYFDSLKELTEAIEKDDAYRVTSIRLPQLILDSYLLKVNARFAAQAKHNAKEND